jgi:phosphoenolpyruvate synthase/pyruvate phosphate dikinase
MSVDSKIYALDVDALSPTINRRAINSALKDDEALNATFIGQERAREALTFGLGINTKGYNLYVMGEPATGRFTLVKDYIERQILAFDPFIHLDQQGVGNLIRMALEQSRKVQKKMEYGICGDHGGDPRSIKFFHRIGIDYVSCSPHLVPVARLAAAKASI